MSQIIPHSEGPKPAEQNNLLFSFQNLYTCILHFVSELNQPRDKNFLSKNNLTILFESTHTLTNSLSRYLTNIKYSVKKSLSDDTKDTEPSIQNSCRSNFNCEISDLNQKLETLESIDLEKLLGLQEKHQNLSVIRSHIDQLSKENKKLQKEINQNEFNCAENK